MNIDAVWLVGLSKTDFSYNHPVHVETLGIGDVVGSIALFSNFVCPGYVSSKQDKNGC